ncbi:MAG TPA: ROK family transcriptional regulator [Ignavibacteriaceae bacterium]|nr:ROK family transcriptional regulator [Ignavibacteriaceae bacterium]
MNVESIIGGNAKVVRNINRSMVLNIIRSKQPLSRTKLARLTGLNKSTISSIVADLLQEELITEEVKIDQNIGRNPLDLSLKLGKYLVGAISIDAAITRIAIADIDGSICGTCSINTEAQQPEDFIKKSIDELERLRIENNLSKLYGVGFSIAGIVDSKKLIVNFAPNLGWENFNIGEAVRKFIPDIEILAVGNDAKNSALAELWYGTHGINLSNYVFLQVGPGIGSGIVVGNKILDGEFHASGEVGHMIIFEGGELCVCGNHGCWERYASDRATISRYAIKKFGSMDQAGSITIDDIVKNSNNNDEIARDTIIQTGYFLGMGIANIIKAYDPHAIIIGGRIIQAWDLIYPEIMEVVKQRAFYGKKKHSIILPTSLKIRPRLLGAATLAIKEIFNDYRIII